MASFKSEFRASSFIAVFRAVRAAPPTSLSVNSTCAPAETQSERVRKSQIEKEK